MKINIGRILTVVNMMLAILLIFFHFTDYSLAGSVPDMIFPLLAGLVALGSWSIMRFGVAAPRTFLNTVSFWISIILGIFPYILLTIFAPIMLLGYMFIAQNNADDRVVQRVLSPNQKIVAEVTYHPVGAYTSGWGAYRITLSSTTIPFVERDIYRTSSNYRGTESTFVEWVDNDTLYIPENDEIVEIGFAKFSISNLLILPLLPVFLFISFVVNIFA